MPRDHRPDHQPLERPPALRVVPGEVMASRLEHLPSRRGQGRLVPGVPWVPRVAWRRAPWGRIALWTVGVLVAGAAAAGLLWLLVQAVLGLVAAVAVLIALIVAWVHAHWVWLVLGAALLLFLLLRLKVGSSSCAGLHCGGCGR
jgi:hypothetical protein